MPRGPCALRPVENRPAAHRAHARWRAWRGCLRSQYRARSNPRRWSRLFFSDTAPGRGLRFRNVLTIAVPSRGAWPTLASPRKELADHPRSTRAGGLGVVIFAANAGALHPTLLDEALFHRHRARAAAVIPNKVATAVERGAARPPRAFSLSEPAGRPWSMGALADLAWLSSQPARGALQPTPSVESLLCRQRARSAAAASN